MLNPDGNKEKSAAASEGRKTYRLFPRTRPSASIGRAAHALRVQDAERYITAAQGAVRRAANHRLRAFSRRQTLDPKSINMNKLAGNLEDLIRNGVALTIWEWVKLSLTALTISTVLVVAS